MCESINEQPPTKICARNPTGGAPRDLKGCPVSEKSSVGHKIHIFADMSMKFGMQAVERPIKCVPERFHTLGALGPYRGQPLGVPKSPLGHEIHIFEDGTMKFGIQAVEWLNNCILERFHSLGGLGPPWGSP